VLCVNPGLGFHPIIGLAADADPAAGGLICRSNHMLGPSIDIMLNIGRRAHFFDSAQGPNRLTCHFLHFP